MGGQKYLFLDVDGVLNCEKCFNMRVEKRIRDGKFNMDAVEQPVARDLHELVEREGMRPGECIGVPHIQALNKLTPHVHVVISSSWRYGFSTAKFASMMKSWGVKGAKVVDLTPAISSADRGDEILKWMSDNEVGVQDIVIVDDDADMGPLMHRLVQTDAKEGLTDKEVSKILSMLR